MSPLASLPATVCNSLPCCNGRALSSPVMAQNAEGSALGPFDCWLLVRGLKTMSLRMERQVGGSWAVCVACRL